MLGTRTFIQILIHGMNFDMVLNKIVDKGILTFLIMLHPLLTVRKAFCVGFQRLGVHEVLS